MTTRSPVSPAKRRLLLFTLGLVTVAAALLTYGLRSASLSSPVEPHEVRAEAPAHYLGSDTCASCHVEEHAAWKASHHHRAMESADEGSVLGDFRDAELRYFGRTTRFSKHGDRFQVTTENQAGQSETFTVVYTLGVEPLQQYLVALEDGRIQALPFAWDARPAEAGGQRWFHLYPDEDVTPQNPLFWTRPQQNWNHMCGDCHTTNFAKNFSNTRGRFESRWSELGNGCESCHGPGSAHVAAQQHPGASREAPPADRSLLGLHTQGEQFDQCGVCHARRVRLREGVAHERMHETWRPELVQDGLYFADGQIKDEVFEIGSFLQSKMAMRGVTCTDCHDPHAARLKAEGNALCTRCHETGGVERTYDTEQHHFHAAGTDGARCVNCHMPSRTYMVVDPRRDHRIAVPRPDLSDALGTPNACTACHRERSNAWAAGAIRDHLASQGKKSGALSNTLGSSLLQVRREQPGAAASVGTLLADPSVAPIARASALAAFANRPSPDALPLIEARLRGEDPWLRLGAVQALSGVPASVRTPLLLRNARDPSRAVRMAVAPLLAELDTSAIDPQARRERAELISDYRDWLITNGDRAGAQLSLADLSRATGDLDAARVAFETALRRDETSLTAHLNFADYYRGTQQDAQAEALLRKASALYPDSADVQFALGLLLVRQKQAAAGVQALARAAELAPDNSHYAYVHAVGLYSTREVERALSTLRAARTRFPQNAELKTALQAYCAEQPKGAFPESCR